MSADLELPGVPRNGSERPAWRIRGSYAELVAVLEELRWHREPREAPPMVPAGRRWYRALVGQASEGRWPLEGQDADTGLSFVDAHMPARITVAGDVLTAWRDRERRAEQVRGPKRNDRIRELAGSGISLKDLARRSGLSVRQVRRIANPRR